ncbi:MAG: type II CRISPR RNA-guided endonuclease Cas9 [Rhodomicrobium sp.]
MQIPLRFAFDLGPNSIGWAVYQIGFPSGAFSPSPRVCKLLDCGVRLFSDGRNPKDGASLAEIRRIARSARRRRDRFLQRRTYLMALLVDYGLMPKLTGERRALASLDPYALRAKGLDGELAPFEIGRALIHLNQRRGFKSDCKADRGAASDKDKGKIADAVSRLKDQLSAANARTIGEFLWRRHGGPDGKATPRARTQENNSTRIRLRGEGAKALYEYYPSREMLEDEFHQLMEAQSRYHPAILTPEALASLHRAIFWQRPLKPVPARRCTLEPTEQPVPRALPSVEARVIYEMLNQLRYGEGLTLTTPLTRNQRDLIAGMLLQGKSLGFGKLRSALKLPSFVRLSLEEGGKKDLKDFASKSATAMRQRFGEGWLGLPLQQKDEVIRRVLDEEDEGALVDWLCKKHGLEHAAAHSVALWGPPEGMSRLGPTANEAVLAELIEGESESGGLLTYAEAVKRAGQRLGRNWHHSDFRAGEIQLPLPYYGKVLERHVAFGSGDPKDGDEKRFGRLSNPSVHIGLNQLRRIVNRLVRVHGEPAQIVIELARELKLTREQKDEERRKNAENRKANDLRRAELEKLGLPDSAENRLRLRLFEKQQRANGGIALCPYSLRPIGIEALFSDAVDIDHVLPFSKTLDDSAANQIVCYRAANRKKGNRSPFEAFGEQTHWERIITAATLLPPNKRWRFAPNAMERYSSKERDFLSRKINETRYLSRMARFYLAAVCGLDNVYVTTGQLTAMLRARWGLNSILLGHNSEDITGHKNRNDHRHHAVDACVIGAIDRGLLQLVARRAAQAELEGRDPTRDVEEPFPGFRDAVRGKVNELFVSVKPDHGRQGALHKDTAYGLITNEAEAADIGNLVVRKPLAELNANEIDRVRDPDLRKRLQALAAPFRNEKGKLTGEKRLKAALIAFGVETAPGRMHGVRRVRIGKREAGTVPIRNRHPGVAYKALSPGDNHHIDIVQMRDGTWQCFPATVFEANQRGWRPDWEREKLGGKLVMRVHKGDMIEVDDADGQRRIKTVHRLSPSNSILYLAAHNEGGELQKRHIDEDDLFRWDFANIGGLKGRNARKVRIDAIGHASPARSNVFG